ncbi:MAG: hypothetical protein ABFR19_05330 [Pseudomonadota bacterium]
MQQHQQALQAVIESIQESPRSAGALILYALMNTINYEQAGCLFKLNKLRDLSPQQRQLAYALIEVMAAGGNRGEAWEQAMQQVDALVRNGGGQDSLPK